MKRVISSTLSKTSHQRTWCRMGNQTLKTTMKPERMIGSHNLQRNYHIVNRNVYSHVKVTSTIPTQQHTLYQYGMFSAISGRIKDAFNIRAKRFGKEEVIKALAEVRQVLLDADIARNSVESLISKIQNEVMEKFFMYDKRALRQADAIRIYKLVQSELEKYVGGEDRFTEALLSQKILVVGTQGSGKTTSAAKIALRLRYEGKHVLVVPLDVVRPAAVQQLITLSNKARVDVIRPTNMEQPDLEDILQQAEKRYNDYDSIIFDTSGRMHVDAEMMDELQTLTKRIEPTEKLLVVDGNTGQDAINTATEFSSKLKVTGVMLSRMDSDAKGGVAISMRASTSVPIKFIGVGEDLSEIERFIPDVMVKRILGESTISNVLDKANMTSNRKHKELIRKKIFTYYDYILGLEQFLNSGHTTTMIRELSRFLKKAPNNAEMEKLMKKFKKQHSRAIRIVDHMGSEEKENPLLLRRMSTRRRYLADRAGVHHTEINQMINDFESMKELHRKKDIQNGGELQAAATEPNGFRKRANLDVKTLAGEFDKTLEQIPDNLKRGRIGRR